MGPPEAFAIWVPIVALAAIEGFRLGFHGRRFEIALGVAAALFAFELFLAAPPVLEATQRWLGRRGGVLAPLVPLCAVLIYSLTITGNWKFLLGGAAYTVIPALLLATSAGKAPGTWEDYAALLAIWLPVALPIPQRLLYRLFPYPPPLTHTLSMLLALSTSVAAFLLLRRLDGIGYEIAWRRGFAWKFGFNFLVFASIAIYTGLRIGFLTFSPSLTRLRSLQLTALGILFFTAWPEEFLFRGLLQNLLSKTLKNEWAGLVAASAIFGLSHIVHGTFPNWKYVLLATIAGLFYGHAWMKSRSLVPGVLVHALVDISWHVLFR